MDFRKGPLHGFALIAKRLLRASDRMVLVELNKTDHAELLFWQQAEAVRSVAMVRIALVQAAAQRCGLAITLRNRQDRSGLIARIEPA